MTTIYQGVINQKHRHKIQLIRSQKQSAIRYEHDKDRYIAEQKCRFSQRRNNTF